MLDALHRFHGLNSLNFAYKRGQVVRGNQLSLRCAPNTRRQTFRVAVVVSKKVDKSAVVRNRIRRRLYEVIRLQTSQLHAPYDLIFTAFNAQLATTEYKNLDKQVAELLRRADLNSGQAVATHTAEHAIINQKKA
ncbi:ribonuclease P protein component [Aeromicrobium sp.]|nr:ribonuclease P protein component [Candidatus Saccharibacteria bacterium]